MVAHSATAIRVASGRLVDLVSLRPEDIRMEDIARSLARQERFTGHCPLRPTIAQHSLAVEHIAAVVDGHRTAPFGLSRAALMHDAAEAYVSDVSAPAKRAMRVRRVGGGIGPSAFDTLEAGAQHVIDTRYDCAYGAWAAFVHQADMLAYAYEAAWGGWSEQTVPSWLQRDLYVQRCYKHDVDGGEAAFLRRAASLGMTDDV